MGQQEEQNEEDIDHGLLLKELLSKYKISEVIYKRWNPSRTRDWTGELKEKTYKMLINVNI